MAITKEDTSKVAELQFRRRLYFRYACLTIGLSLPLLLAFIFTRNIYPFGASTMMLGLQVPAGSHEYYILQGETVTGDVIDLPPIKLTDALTGRNWSLVSAAVSNKSFTIRYPHPENLRTASSYGGTDKLPKGARLDELLRAWGAIYNARLSESSNQKLKAIKLNTYQWEGGLTGEYARFVGSWRTTL